MHFRDPEFGYLRDPGFGYSRDPGRGYFRDPGFGYPVRRRDSSSFTGDPLS